MTASKEECSKTWETALQFFKTAEERFQTEVIDFYEEHIKNQNKKKRKKRRKKVPNVKQKNESKPQVTAAVPASVEEDQSILNRSILKRSAAAKASSIISQQVNISLSAKMRNPHSSSAASTSIVVQEQEGSYYCLRKSASVTVQDPNLSNMRNCSVVVQRCNLSIINELSDDNIKVSAVPEAKPKSVESLPDKTEVCNKKSKINEVQGDQVKNPALDRKIQLEESIQNDNSEKIETSSKSETMSLASETLDNAVKIKPLKSDTVSLVSESLDCSIKSHNVTEAGTNCQNPSAEMSDVFLRPSALGTSGSRNNDSKAETSGFFLPKRVRTKSRLYNNDDYESMPLKRKSKVTKVPAVVIHESTTLESMTLESTDCNEAGKRKSGSEDNSCSSQKKPKLDHSTQSLIQNKTENPPTTQKVDNVNNTENDDKLKVSSTREKADLQVPEKSCPTTSSSSSESQGNLEEHKDKENTTPPVQPPPQRVFADLVTPKIPEGRVTRTRTKEMKKVQMKSALLNRPDKEVSVTIGKNNSRTPLIKSFLSSEKKNTPLQINNKIFSPLKVFKHNEMKKAEMPMGQNKILSKMDAAAENKKNKIQASTDALKRKRQEKKQKQMALKQVREKEKQEKIERLLHEQAEKEKQIEKIKRLKEERALQKKHITETMLKEAEERRLQEEEAKRAHIRKLEEERKRQEEERLRQVEEAKKLNEMRLAQQAVPKPLVWKDTFKKPKKDKVISNEEYQMTPSKDEQMPKKPKSSNDYGISDEGSGDSTDDESNPKKLIPKWAARSSRQQIAITQSRISCDVINILFPQYIDLDAVKSSSARCRMRASSALWDSPIAEKI